MNCYEVMVQGKKGNTKAYHVVAGSANAASILIKKETEKEVILVNKLNERPIVMEK